MTHRLCLVDDHPVVRAGLKAFLNLQADLEVVAEAGSVAEAKALDPDLRPDLVLLDIKLPDGPGTALIEPLRALPSRPRIVILTSYLDDATVRDAMNLGASGYLLKHIGPEALLDRVRAALRGELPMDPRAVRSLSRPPTPDPIAELTARERDVLACIAEGITNREIGERLGITEKTVKAHAGNIFAKLGVESRTQAALLAKELGV